MLLVILILISMLIFVSMYLATRIRQPVLSRRGCNHEHALISMSCQRMVNQCTSKFSLNLSA